MGGYIVPGEGGGYDYTGPTPQKFLYFQNGIVTEVFSKRGRLSHSQNFLKIPNFGLSTETILAL